MGCAATSSHRVANGGCTPGSKAVLVSGSLRPWRERVCDEGVGSWAAELSYADIGGHPVGAALHSEDNHSTKSPCSGGGVRVIARIVGRSACTSIRAELL